MKFLFKPADIIQLDAFRVALGVSLLLFVAEWGRNADEWLTTAGWHPSAENLMYHYFYVPPLPEWALPWFCIQLFASIILLIAGWKQSWTIPWALFNVLYITFVDQLSAFTLNKLFSFGLLLLWCAPRGPYWSIGSKAVPVQSVWPIRILQATLIVSYCGAGLGKIIYGNWLTSPIVLWSQAQGWYRTEVAVLFLNHLPMGAWTFMQWCSLLFEIFSPVLFIWKKTRIGALWFGLFFHVFIGILMYQVIYFSLAVLAFYTVFIPPEQLHRLHDFCSKLVNSFKKRKYAVS